MSSFEEESLLDFSVNDSSNPEMGLNLFAPLITTDTFEFEALLENQSETFRGKSYYPTNNTGNLPLVIIWHADGLPGPSDEDHLQYESLAVKLAKSGLFVLSANRVKHGNVLYKHLAPEAIKRYIYYLYEHYNNEIILDYMYLPPPLGQSQLIGKDIMFIGHSAGGYAVLKYGKSTIESLHQNPLNLKALGLIAPTIPSDVPHHGHTPIFIVQSTADSDGDGCNHYGHGVSDPLSYKVPILEMKTNAVRGYILIKGNHNGFSYNHWIQNELATIQILIAVAKAFLKDQTQDLKNYIMLQQQSLTSIDPYLTDSYIQYWRPNNVLHNPVSFTSVGLSVLHGPSDLHLGMNNSITKSLNYADSYRITRGGVLGVKYPTRSVSFSFADAIEVSEVNYLHFRAGELVNFTIGESLSFFGIGGKVRLIFNNFILGEGYEMSEWVDLTTSIGNIKSPSIGLCPRNSMRSYTIPMSVFNLIGTKSVIGVQFDFTGEIESSNQRVYLNDIYFLQ